MRISGWRARVTRRNDGEKIRLSRPGDQELGHDRFYIREEQVT